MAFTLNTQPPHPKKSLPDVAVSKPNVSYIELYYKCLFEMKLQNLTTVTLKLGNAGIEQLSIHIRCDSRPQETKLPLSPLWNHPGPTAPRSRPGPAVTSQPISWKPLTS